MKPPVVNIDPEQFHADPYPTLQHLRENSPVAMVPQLNAVLLSRHGDIVRCEKMIDVFSSEQPGGLMTELMGENMMRKDGPAHLCERRQLLPAVAPRAVKEFWRPQFEKDTNALLQQLSKLKTFDVVTDYAMPVSANALRHMTGLLNLSTEEMDFVSQAMIDGVANYTGDAAVEKQCRDATSMIDARIDQMLDDENDLSDTSMLGVLRNAGQPLLNIKANIKLAISGGQNEPRDAIAGAIGAMLLHPNERLKISTDSATWLQVFEEYARWMSPIGMSPRRIATSFKLHEVDLVPNDRAFLMFGSANRDHEVFTNPDVFDVSRSTTHAVSFGAGPHFCVGAAASRCLIAEVALPMFFRHFPEVTLAGDIDFVGWAFRGPISVSVRTH